MKFDYELLRERITVCFGKVSEFAKAANMTLLHTFNLLNGTEQWSMKEIDTTCDVLHIPSTSIPVYFFTAK